MNKFKKKMISSLCVALSAAGGAALRASSGVLACDNNLSTNAYANDADVYLTKEAFDAMGSRAGTLYRDRNGRLVNWDFMPMDVRGNALFRAQTVEETSTQAIVSDDVRDFIPEHPLLRYIEDNEDNLLISDNRKDGQTLVGLFTKDMKAVGIYPTGEIKLFDIDDVDFDAVYSFSYVGLKKNFNLNEGPSQWATQRYVARMEKLPKWIASQKKLEESSNKKLQLDRENMPKKQGIIDQDSGDYVDVKMLSFMLAISSALGLTW